MDIKGKKVLLMGLGILGGGVATARFLVEQGAILTVTDMKDANYLASSLEKLSDLKEKIKWVLGEHREEDFLECDILVINPDVPASNPFVEKARQAGKPIENELTLFFKFSPCKSIIAITGTRGKTTTTNWTGHILKEAGIDARVIGNDPERPFLSEIKKCTKDTVAVIETPSFQLEIFGESGCAPHIAVITNLYQDHLSRHKTMEEYALAKANIFKNQKPGDYLLLDDYFDEWTQFFISKSSATVHHYADFSIIGFDARGFAEKYGRHNLKNLRAAISACHFFGLTLEQILPAIETLPFIHWRQELVYESDKLKIYNDTAATSPEASMVAIERFHTEKQKSAIPSLGRFFPDLNNMILICGGTDRELEFKGWAQTVKKYLKPEQVVFLSGSATEKMKKELEWESYNEHDTLEQCFKSALDLASRGRSVIVFSPGAKSFEKFKNEFDRGEKFNELVKML